MPASNTPEFSIADVSYMARALELARRGTYTAHPNPRVGCVLARDGRIVGEGWHRKTGEAHAESLALAAAGENARGATAYVTLEPCSHQGKTPPCADALIAAGVTKVVCALLDPNHKVSGNGHRRLEAAGIEVRQGLLHAEAERLNAGFLSRMRRGQPFVRLKVAASLDGRTAMADGQSQWITGPEARRDVQRLRAASGAIMTGISTVLADDPSLNVRREDLDCAGMQPLRVVLDSHLQLPPSARMLQLPGRTAVFCASSADGSPLQEAGAEIYPVPQTATGLDLSAVLGKLAALEINDVLVEAGPVLAGSLLLEGLLDELVIYQAPHIMGSETRGMFCTKSWQAIEQRQGLEIVDFRKVGADLRITARPAT